MYNISKNSARKSASGFDGLRPVCNFLESSNSKRKKRCAQISVFLILVKSGQTMVKLLIQEVLMLLHNYWRILALLNNYFNFLNFGQIWSNYGQTMVKLIQEILVLLNNWCFFRIIISNSNGEMCDLMLKLNCWGLIGFTAYICQGNNKCRLGK